VQVVTVPDGWPIWTSPVRPGREHDTTCLCADPEALPLLAEWTDEGPRRPRRPGLRGRTGDPDHPDQTNRRPAPDRRRAHGQRAARGHPGAGRARQLAAQDHLQGPASGQPVPLAHRRDHRRRPGPAPPHPQPHHM